MRFCYYGLCVFSPFTSLIHHNFSTRIVIITFLFSQLSLLKHLRCSWAREFEKCHRFWDGRSSCLGQSRLKYFVLRILTLTSMITTPSEAERSLLATLRCYVTLGYCQTGLLPNEGGVYFLWPLRKILVNWLSEK